MKKGRQKAREVGRPQLRHDATSALPSPARRSRRHLLVLARAERRTRKGSDDVHLAAASNQEEERTHRRRSSPPRFRPRWRWPRHLTPQRCCHSPRLVLEQSRGGGDAARRRKQGKRWRSEGAGEEAPLPGAAWREEGDAACAEGRPRRRPACSAEREARERRGRRAVEGPVMGPIRQWL